MRKPDEPPAEPETSSGWSAARRRVASGLGRYVRGIGTRFNARKGGARAPAGRMGSFIDGHFGEASSRRFRLYVPGVRPSGPAPLLVMLHGCEQDADDFAAATRMNEVAEPGGVYVLYPEQCRSANAQRCWNWYARDDATGKNLDAALVAALTRQVMRDHDIDPARVYVAGMSAGGALATVLVREDLQLFAALGVHSGVPAGHARDMFSALRLMSQGPGRRADDYPAAVPTIVFHGDEDRRVHPSNALAIHRAHRDSDSAGSSALDATTEAGAGQHGFTRSVESGLGGVTRRELWIVHGAGHAWAGGNIQHRQADANGPDASGEMMRFFLQHRLAGQAARSLEPP